MRRSTKELISKLKQQHVCTVHLQENNEPGLCFVTPSGTHIHLEDGHLTTWASALVSTCQMPQHNVCPFACSFSHGLQLANEDCTISVPPKSTGLMDTPDSVDSATHPRSTVCNTANLAVLSTHRILNLGTARDSIWRQTI